MKKPIGFAGLLPLAFAPAASADERTCRGKLGAITVDDLRVPDGATCTLDGTPVKARSRSRRARRSSRAASASSATSRPRTLVL